MTEITVIDSVMGQGKTTYVHRLMRDNPDSRYIYIGVSLDESERCAKACADLDMRNPIPRHGVKYWDLVQLVGEGRNIASTHQLFRRMTINLYEQLRGKDYTLIIDEALDVVSQYTIHKQELEWLMASEVIYVDEKHLVRWNYEKWPNYNKIEGGKYHELLALCDNGNIVQTRHGILIWQFPAWFLDVFKQVYICTYMFEGQVMADYLKANGVPYTLKALQDGELVDYAAVDNTAQKERLADLIRLDMHEGRNSFGRPELTDFAEARGQPFTSTWYDQRALTGASFQMKRELQRLASATAAFFKEYGKGAAFNMWTTFDKHKSRLAGDRFRKHKVCFVPMNAKATNKWDQKSALAYLVDRRQSPIVAGYFEDIGVPIREDLFALTEMIRWIWRSRIRKQDPEPIQLYLPSYRMRAILINWIKYSDAEIVSGKRLDVKEPCSTQSE